MSSIADFGNYFINMITSMRIVDFIDIALVSVLIYYIIKFTKERRAGILALGIVSLILFRIISGAIGLSVINYIMDAVFQISIIALIVLFQPELRSLLERVGAGTVKGLSRFKDSKDKSFYNKLNTEIVSACSSLSESKTGALIVLERNVKLGDIISSGTVINAETSSILLRNIFYNKSPLHDGAVIIRDGRIYAAGCLLPLSQNNDIDRMLGTRHRAALGMSEISDAVTIVISEETGNISVAVNGNLNIVQDKNELRLILDKKLSELTAKISRDSSDSSEDENESKQ